MKILFITELYPSPNQGGEYLRTNGLVKILNKTRHEFFSIFGYRDKMSEINLPKEKFTIYNFRVHYADNRIIHAFKTFKRQSSLIKIIDSVVSSFKPDLVFIDYYYYGQYIPYLKKKGLPVIFGTHNIQSKLILQIPATNIKKKLTRYLSYKIYQFHEKYFLTKADAIISVSEKDSEYYRSYISSEKIFCIPNFVDSDDYQITISQKQNYIIMPANFGAYQNKVGLEWFLEKVWSPELSKLTKLVLIGRASDKIFNQLNENKNYQNIEAVGEVDNIMPYISKAKATIVPLLHGSGTRLKCIESMALKTQIISTTVGAEGIEHDGSIIIADSPQDFKNAIIRVINENLDFTDKAYKIFVNNYSLDKASKVFVEVISHVFSK
jgi:polysaccharide biosynthesis protein PslH